MRHLDAATQCAEDVERVNRHPDDFVLLLTRGQILGEFVEQYIEAALQDLQGLMEQAWDAGEVGVEGEQIHMPWGRRHGAKEAA